MIARVVRRLRQLSAQGRAAWRYRGVVRQVSRVRRRSDLAVVVNLYHPEVWPEISERLDPQSTPARQGQ